MTETSKTPEERRLRFILAQSVWRAQKGPDLPSDAEERKAAWEQDKTAELQKAMRLMRMLENRGVTLTLSSDAEASETA